jgi:crotonobetainyl-CoA:carnitine CoA-transferase CaiB-like acyl-CoA transferase
MATEPDASKAAGANKPLAGIRVLEFGGYIAAPYTASILCALGADVVKVERPTGEDFRRGMDDRSRYFQQYNAGKRSLAVDLKDPAGLALIQALVPRFDVLLENQRPGKMAALGLGQAECVALKPDLVYASVTGFGNGGPWAQRPAYDTIGQAFGGVFSVMSDAGAMQLSGTCIADLVTGLAATTGVLAGLVARGLTSAAQHVETSIAESMSAITIDAMTQLFDDGHRDPSRQSRHPQGSALCLETASGAFIAVHLSSSQKFWESLVAAMGRHELNDDPRFATYNSRVANYLELADVVQAEFLERSIEDWEKLLVEYDVPFSPVHTLSQYRDHPQIEWLDIFEPERNGLSLVRPPFRFGGTRPDRREPTPRVGQHSRDIALEVYDRSRVEELIDSGVIVAAT